MFYEDRQIFYRHHLRPNLNWKQHAQTIAGGHGKGNQLNQLNCPLGIYVDVQQQSIYIADHYNHRIVKWKLGENTGQIIAGGTGKGHRIDQLNCPTDVIVDYNNKSLIICDYGNKRVVQCSLENQQDKQVLISDILCWGLILNENGDLFVSDCWKHEVRRWRKGSEKEGTIVAGGNGEGNKLNQLNHPTFIFVDRHESIYVSDWGNQRVMKWMKGAHEGIVVAGGQGIGDSLKQLYYPYGVIVNEIGDVFVNDHENHRIMCWPSGSKEGHIVVGGNGQGEGSNQFNGLRGLSFDVENNLYVVDVNNNRIQRFNVDNHEK